MEEVGIPLTGCNTLYEDQKEHGHWASIVVTNNSSIHIM